MSENELPTSIQCKIEPVSPNKAPQFIAECGAPSRLSDYGSAPCQKLPSQEYAQNISQQAEEVAIGSTGFLHNRQSSCLKVDMEDKDYKEIVAIPVKSNTGHSIGSKVNQIIGEQQEVLRVAEIKLSLREENTSSTSPDARQESLHVSANTTSSSFAFAQEMSSQNTTSTNTSMQIAQDTSSGPPDVSSEGIICGCGIQYKELSSSTHHQCQKVDSHQIDKTVSVTPGKETGGDLVLTCESHDNMDQPTYSSPHSSAVIFTSIDPRNVNISPGGLRCRQDRAKRNLVVQLYDCLKQNVNELCDKSVCDTIQPIDGTGGSCLETLCVNGRGSSMNQWRKGSDSKSYRKKCKTFPCTECNIIFTRKWDLLSHQREHKIKPHKCPYCSRTFQKSSACHRHQQLFCSKPVVCSCCQQDFGTVKERLKHELTHVSLSDAKRRAFELKLYGSVNPALQNTRVDSSLGVSEHGSNHPKNIVKLQDACRVKKDDGSKVVKAKEDAKGKDPEAKETSAKIFEPVLACEICKKKFSRLDNLRRHENNHSKKKQFECNICKRKYGRNDVLRQHYISVHGERFDKSSGENGKEEDGRNNARIDRSLLKSERSPVVTDAGTRDVYDKGSEVPMEKGQNLEHSADVSKGKHQQRKELRNKVDETDRKMAKAYAYEENKAKILSSINDADLGPKDQLMKGLTALNDVEKNINSGRSVRRDDGENEIGQKMVTDDYVDVDDAVVGDSSVDDVVDSAHEVVDTVVDDIEKHVAGNGDDSVVDDSADDNGVEGPAVDDVKHSTAVDDDVNLCAIDGGFIHRDVDDDDDNDGNVVESSDDNWQPGSDDDDDDDDDDELAKDVQEEFMHNDDDGDRKSDEVQHKEIIKSNVKPATGILQSIKLTKVNGRYPCDTCGKSYSKGCNLKRHMLAHLDTADYQCSKCARLFKRKDAHQKHEESCLCKCRFCRKKWKCKNDCDKHEQNCPAAKYVKEIEENGSSNGERIVKVKDETVEAEDIALKQQYRCTYCLAVYTKKYDLIKHVQIHGGKNTQQFRCYVCGKIHSDKDVWEEHQSVCSDKFSCRFCDAKFNTSKDGLLHEKKHSKDIRRHVCKFCGNGFKDRKNCQRHERRHLGPVTCQLCGFECSSSETYKYHKKTKHGSKEQNLCSICGKAFTNRISLRVHEARHGGSQRKYPCEECGKRFETRSDVRKHRRIHSDVRNFLCRHCGKGFKDEYHLRHHEMTHGDRIFKCDLCEKMFKTPEARAKHQPVHTGIKAFKCSHCDKYFSSQAGKYAHEKTHSDVKPHICEFCDKRFRLKHHLGQHLKTHTNERPYVCKVCGDGFKIGHHLTQHMSTHENKGRKK